MLFSDKLLTPWLETSRALTLIHLLGERGGEGKAEWKGVQALSRADVVTLHLPTKCGCRYNDGNGVGENQFFCYLYSIEKYEKKNQGNRNWAWGADP